MQRCVFRPVALALALLLALPNMALAGQTIIIDSTNPAIGDVFGNSLHPNGAGPPLGDPNDNTVIINSDVSGSVYGGHDDKASGTGNATANTNRVIINDGKVDWHVYGGRADGTSGDATANNNRVIINDGTVKMDVYGGHADSASGTATTTGNNVSISGGTVDGNVYGGEARNASATDTATATGNNVSISGGEVNKEVYGGYAFSTSGKATATGNSIIISGGTVFGNAYGGDAESTTGTGTATATGNSVTISGGTVFGNAYGGWAGSDNGDAVANNNRVSISGDGTVKRDVYGGRANSTNGGATATGNSVSISGGTVDGNVYGGEALNINGNATATATRNTVTISGNLTFGAGTVLYGGYATVGGALSGDAFSGNTLNLWNTSGIKAHGVENFQFFNFLIPTTQSGPVLEVTGTATLGDRAGKASSVTAVNTYGAAPMPAGSSVTLIKAGTLDAADFDQSQIQGKHGGTIRYLWSLDTANNELTATAVHVGAAPEAKVLSEGYIAGLALINQGADLIAGKGIANALSAAGPRGASGFGSFGAIAGGSSRYSTGSHVDVSGLSLIAGLSFGADLAPGRLTVGAFFEYGSGSYDTYNSFGNVDSHGNGNMRHLRLLHNYFK